jgi:hypothetical protein
MKLGVEVIELGNHIYYHVENDAVLIVKCPTDMELDGFVEFDELVIDSSNPDSEDTEVWNIVHAYSGKDFLKVCDKLLSVGVRNEDN